MSKDIDYLIPQENGGSTNESLEAEALSGKRSEWQHFTPEFVDTQTANLDTKRLLRQDSDTRQNKRATRLEQDHATVRIPSDLPIGVAFIGDTHIGSVFTNMPEVLRKIQTVKETPNMYAIFMGNIIDNAIPAQFPDNMLSNTMNPDKQVELAQRLIKDLDASHKVIAAVTSPCHEGWSWKKAGQDVNRLIYGYEGRQFPVMENGGELDIKVGKQTYKGALYHQTGPFNSNFNETHAVKQMHRLNLQMDKDFVAGAHNHVGAVEEVFEGTGRSRRKVTYIRTGSEKGTGDLHDPFVQGRSGKTGEPSGQTLELFPDKHDSMAELDFDTGVALHESVYIAGMVKKGKK